MSRSVQRNGESSMSTFGVALSSSSKPMELDLAPSLSRSRNQSESSASESTKPDVNRKLTKSPNTSRAQRPPTLPPPPNSTTSSRLSVAISGLYNNTFNNSQNVRPFPINRSPASFSINTNQSNSNVSPHSPLQGSNVSPASAHHVSLNNSNTRPRTSNQVFHSTSDLAAHYGIPQFLPPAPRTTPRRITDVVPTPEPEFADICNSYLNMLSQNPGEPSMTEDQSMTSVPTAYPSAVTQEDAVRALIDVFQASSSPEMQMTAEFSEYLTSPFDDSPFEDDLLITPAMGTSGDFADILTSPIMGDWNSPYQNTALFDDSFSHFFPPVKEQYQSTSTVAPTSVDLNAMWTLSPQTPALEHSPAVANDRPLPHQHQRRKVSATGTRKNVTPETLVPIDAPTQPRKYITPSSTSRKEVPAVFARKRSRSQAFADEEDQLEEEMVTLPPNPTEQELIEAKRRQNTIAARRSRKRKLEYQRELEDQLDVMKDEKDMWKSRSQTCEALLRSHGLEVPHFDS